MPKYFKRTKKPFESDDETINELEDISKFVWWEKPSVVFAPVSSNGDTTGFGGSDTLNSAMSRLSSDGKNSNNEKKVKNRSKKSKKVSVKLPKFKNNKKKSQKEESLPDYFGPEVDIRRKRFNDARNFSESSELGTSHDEIGFNLPRVSAQLEKLMGTNVVRLTDRKYMQELRKRIQDDYNATLQKRISQREYEEGERQKHLILKGSYSPENCPSKLVIVHSVALAKEMERERNLIMAGKGEKCPGELSQHPVFIVNQNTNNVIARNRAKLKTTREKNAERLIRQGAKWERERLMYDEMDRRKEIESKSKREAALIMEDGFTKSNRVRGVDLLRIKDRQFTECEMDLKEFLDCEKDTMTKQNQSEDKKSSKQTKREKRAQKKLDDSIKSGATLKLPQIVDSLKSELKTLYTIDDDQNDESESTSTKKGGKANEETSSELSGDDEISADEYAKDYQKISKHQFEIMQHYEDPLVVKLRETQDVKELYNLADEIILGPVV